MFLDDAPLRRACAAHDLSFLSIDGRSRDPVARKGMLISICLRVSCTDKCIYCSEAGSVQETQTWYGRRRGRSIDGRCERLRSSRNTSVHQHLSRTFAGTNHGQSPFASSFGHRTAAACMMFEAFGFSANVARCRNLLSATFGRARFGGRGPLCLISHFDFARHLRTLDRLLTRYFCLLSQVTEQDGAMTRWSGG